MEFNLLTLIGIGLFAMFFGYFFGLFEGRGQGYKRRKKEEATEAPAIPTPKAAPAPPTPSTPDKSLLRLSLGAGQKPTLDLDGRPVDVTGLSAEQRKRLIDLMVVMRPWIEAAPASKPIAVPAPAASPAPMVMAVPEAIPTAMPGAGLTAGNRPAPEPGTPTTMVGQIDAILQARLAGTALAGRGIRLTESSQGGAAIFIGMQRYAGLGDVPDPEVQAAIKAAIAEWEAKYTPS